MSQKILLPLQGETTWPPHSEQCFTEVNSMCEECYGLLAPYPISQRRAVWLKHWCRQHGLAEPLPEKFMDRLRATLAAQPEKYAGIIQFLANYQEVSK